MTRIRFQDQPYDVSNAKMQGGDGFGRESHLEVNGTIFGTSSLYDSGGANRGDRQNFGRDQVAGTQSLGALEGDDDISGADADEEFFARTYAGERDFESHMRSRRRAAREADGTADSGVHEETFESLSVRTTHIC